VTVASFLDDRLPPRFWNKVQPCPMSGCWLWVGGSTSAGYGVVTIDGRRSHRVQSTAHRWAYEVMVGQVPDGLELDHYRCDLKCCCNPSHLRAVTHRVNLARSNSISTVNAQAVACPSGHPYDETNTYVHPRTGYRQCRICRRAHDVKRHSRR
jgi:hypothetical protein